MLFLIALQFLTRISIKQDLHITDSLLARSMIFFPIVGLLIGGIQALVFRGIHKFLSPSATALFLVIISIILTGALHIEGFADTMDGFLGGSSKDKILQIMRDSRIGAIGAVSVACLILAKFIFLREIIEKLFPLLIIKMLLIIPCLSRWTVVISAGISQYARPGSGLGGPFTELVGTKIVCLASIIPIISSITLFPRHSGILGLGIAGFVAFIVSRITARKISGITGDVLGGVNEITEIGLLLTTMLLIVH